MTIYSTMVAGRNPQDRADIDAWLGGARPHELPSRRVQMGDFLRSELGAEGLPDGVSV